MTRVLVCGGRDFRDRALVFETMDALLKERGIATVIHGCASGADHEAEVWSVSRRLKVMRYAADWKQHGRAAGPIRNAKMLADGKPDVVVAFPGGRGTADMVRRARAANVEVIEVEG